MVAQVQFSHKNGEENSFYRREKEVLRPIASKHPLEELSLRYSGFSFADL